MPVIKIEFSKRDPKQSFREPHAYQVLAADRAIIADLQTFVSAARDKVEHGIKPVDRAQMLLLWGIVKDHPEP